jgi:DNA gyrase/topoisomerase IV subunit B
MSLTPIGSTCHFEIVDIDGNHHRETIINKEGIITDLIMKVNKPINKPIIINADDGYHKLDLAFCYDAGDDQNGPESRESITSFANFCPTLGGTHVDGVLDGIVRWYSQYMNSIYLVNQKAKNKIKVTSSDIKTGLNCMISAAHLTPVMTGQSKELLANEDMTGFCKDIVMKGLDEWSKSNPQDLARLAKFFKDVAELRMKDEAGRSKIVQKFKKNANNNLPEKYVRPLGNKDIELVLVEGDKLCCL